MVAELEEEQIVKNASTPEKTTGGRSIKCESKSSENIIPLPIIVSCFALAVSIGAALFTYFHDPMGSGLRKYNLKTPKDSLLSVWQIQETHDLKATIELASQLDSVTIGQRRDSLRVWKEIDWRGKRILFCSWEENGGAKYQCEAFEKEVETGLWLPSTIPYIYDVEKTGSPEDKRVTEMVQDWRAKDESDTIFNSVIRDLEGE